MVFSGSSKQKRVFSEREAEKRVLSHSQYEKIGVQCFRKSRKIRLLGTYAVERTV